MNMSGQNHDLDKKNHTEAKVNVHIFSAGYL